MTGKTSPAVSTVVSVTLTFLCRWAVAAAHCADEFNPNAARRQVGQLRQLLV